jgi:lysozyme
MNSQLELSPHALALLETLEGFRPNAYKPTPHDVWTLGYGHTQGVQKGDTITRAEAQDLLRSDVKKFEWDVQDLVKVPLTQGQFDALVLFTFNLGREALATSHLLKYINEHRFTLAAGEFPKWIYQTYYINVKKRSRILPGLVHRREIEQALFKGETNVEA